jgi:hypothetical protein
MRLGFVGLDLMVPLSLLHCYYLTWSTAHRLTLRLTTSRVCASDHHSEVLIGLLYSGYVIHPLPRPLLARVVYCP